MLIFGTAITALLEIFTLWRQHQFDTFISQYAIAFEIFRTWIWIFQISHYIWYCSLRKSAFIYGTSLWRMVFVFNGKCKSMTIARYSQKTLVHMLTLLWSDDIISEITYRSHANLDWSKFLYDRYLTTFGGRLGIFHVVVLYIYIYIYIYMDVIIRQRPPVLPPIHRWPPPYNMLIFVFPMLYHDIWRGHRF